MRNRQFVFTPKIEYKLVAERSEADQKSLTFPTWCPGRESNPHVQKDTAPQAAEYTNSSTWAFEN